MAKIANKWYDQNLAGIPQIINSWGSLTTYLDAVLVNGFNVKPATAIARVNHTVTIYSPAHGFVKYQVISVSGWDQTEYNGEFIVTRAAADSYDYEVIGTPATPGTGAGTVKAAPLGFEIVYTGTNKRAYRTLNLSSNRPFLRVDDSMPAGYTTTWGKSARVTMAESMTDINTFAGARAPYDAGAPTRNETPTGTGSTIYAGWYRWYYSWGTAGAVATSGDGGSTPRQMALSGDNRSFMFFINSFPTTNNARSAYGFGDFTSYKAADGFNSMLVASDTWTPASTGWYPGYGSDFTVTGTSQGKVVMKDYTQIGGTTGLQLMCLNVNNSTLISGDAANVPFPHGPDYSLLLLPLFLREDRRGDFRGVFPGIYFTPQLRPFEDGTIIDNVAGYEGRRFLCVSVGHVHLAAYTDTGRVFIDLTGPWR